MANRRTLADYRPSLWQRLTASLRFFRGGIDGVGGWSAKRAPFEWPDFRQRQVLQAPTDYVAYAEEGYAQNALIYAAVAYKCRAVSAAPLRAYTGDPDQPETLPPKHPLSRLLTRPNPYQSGSQWMQLNTAYLNLSGNCYIYIDRQTRDLALYTLRPDRVFIIPGERGSLKGYLYVPEGKTRLDGVPLLPQDTMHVKLPNPLDELEGLGYGLSPLSALALSGDVDNQVTAYLKTFFAKGTMNNLILKFNVPLDDDQIASIRRRWQEVYGGTENWAKIGVLDDSGEVQRLGLNFQEMGFEGIDSRNESRILAPFGVPPILVGSRYGLERSTYSNYQEARKAFWEDTFVPELGLYESSLDYYLAQGDEVSIRFDTSQVPALRVDVAKQVEAATRLFSMGVPANLALATVGLPIEKVEGGDVGYLPLNLVPVGTPRTPPAAPGQQLSPGGKPRSEPESESSEGDEEDQAEEGAEGESESEEETRKGVVRPFRRLGAAPPAQGAHPGARRGGGPAGGRPDQVDRRRVGHPDA